MEAVDHLEENDKLKPLLADRWIDPLDREACLATVALVLEPLKVRTLTKGMAVEQYLAKSLQRTMWEALLRLKPFELVGREVDGTVIDDVVNLICNWDKKKIIYDLVKVERGKNTMKPIKIEIKEGTLYISGDYSAATDGLNPWLSQRILKLILERVKAPQWYGEMCLQVLGKLS